MGPDGQGAGRTAEWDLKVPSVSPRSMPYASSRLVLHFDMLTPAVALQLLKDGNARFVAGTPSRHDVHEAMRVTAEGQTPFVAIVSCIDSRVPVETVFDLTIGHAFSARVAGNVLSDDVIGSLEFACALAGSRLIVILGHTGCGAVKGAVDGAELGHLTGLLAKIQPAVEATDAAGERTSANASFVDAVAEENVRRMKAQLLDQSGVLRERAEAGHVGVVGAMYDVRTGRVVFLEDGGPH